MRKIALALAFLAAFIPSAFAQSDLGLKEAMEKFRSSLADLAVVLREESDVCLKHSGMEQENCRVEYVVASFMLSHAKLLYSVLEWSVVTGDPDRLERSKKLMTEGMASLRESVERLTKYKGGAGPKAGGQGV